MLNLLVSKALSIKYSAQKRSVREQFPNICLTLARRPQYRCSCALTRIRRLFQIRSVQRSSDFCSHLPANWTHQYFSLHLQPFPRFSPLLNFTRVFLPVKTLSLSHSKIGRNKLYSFCKISANIFSLLYFKICLQS